MIANRAPAGWEIVYQPAHALLSAQLAARWQAGARPARLWETLVAIAQHDNGWHDWEQAPQVHPDGTPRNFTEMALGDAIAQWRRGVARASHQGRWVGLLVSRHATTLFAARRGEDGALDRFLAEQQAQQEAWRRALGVAEGEIAHAYALLRWTDWLSLVLCWRRLPDDGRPVALGEGPDGASYEAMRRADGTVAVAPWPFDEPRFTVEVEIRAIGEQTFEGSEALAMALSRARVEVHSWELTA